MVSAALLPGWATGKGEADLPPPLLYAGSQLRSSVRVARVTGRELHAFWVP
jgi:hypothetical protein